MPVPDVGIEDEDEESTTDAVESAELAEVVVEPPRIEVAFMPDKGRDKERGLLEVSVLDALDVPIEPFPPLAAQLQRIARRTSRTSSD